MKENSHKVAIVGAGPVGLFSALRLSDFGIPCVLFEACETLPIDLRASTFHPPTLEILNAAGVVDALVQKGRICKTWQIRRHPQHEYVEFDLSILKDDTPYPYRLQVEQYKLCQILLAELKQRSNVDLRFGQKLTKVSQTLDQVTLELNSGPEAIKHTAEFLIGADGAKSQVRKSLNMAFGGHTYPETTILATTRFPFEDHLPNLSDINYVWKKSGTFSLLHLPEIWRCSLYPNLNETIDEALTPPSIQRKLKEIVPRDSNYEVEDIRPYRIHKRIVDDYRVGRIILAGDAAHINSPSGGMGMNGGIHDAWFLTEALNAIERGAPLDRLDLYTRQRRPVAHEQILSQSDQNRRRMQERDPVERGKIFSNLQRLCDNQDELRAYLCKTSMIEGWQASINTV